ELNEVVTELCRRGRQLWTSAERRYQVPMQKCTEFVPELCRSQDGGCLAPGREVRSGHGALPALRERRRPEVPVLSLVRRPAAPEDRRVLPRPPARPRPRAPRLPLPRGRAARAVQRLGRGGRRAGRRLARGRRGGTARPVPRRDAPAATAAACRRATRRAPRLTAR